MERKSIRIEKNTYFCKYCRIYVRPCLKKRHQVSFKHIRYVDQHLNFKYNNWGSFLIFV